ncbi:MAG: DMT family transporter [Anaerolineales bacterium]
MKANGMLLLTAIIWGGGFVAQRIGMRSMGPYMFNGFRFALGAITLLPFLLRRNSDRLPDLRSWKSVLGIGMIAGLFLFFGATFQQLGLVYTTAGKAGFVTGLYVILVPLLGALWGDRAPLQSWLGAILAVVGLYFLSMKEDLSLEVGDAYVLVGAFFWAGHVQYIANFSSEVSPLRLSFVQSVVTSVVSFSVGLLVEDTNSAMIAGALGAIFYGGVISIGIAYTLQIMAQQKARPTPAAIILSLESVFAVLWGWIFLGEILSRRGLLGSGLMLCGMVLAQMNSSKKKKDQEWKLYP